MALMKDSRGRSYAPAARATSECLFRAEGFSRVDTRRTAYRSPRRDERDDQEGEQRQPDAPETHRLDLEQKRFDKACEIPTAGKPDHAADHQCERHSTGHCLDHRASRRAKCEANAYL